MIMILIVFTHCFSWTLVTGDAKRLSLIGSQSDNWLGAARCSFFGGSSFGLLILIRWWISTICGLLLLVQGWMDLQDDGGWRLDTVICSFSSLLISIDIYFILYLLPTQMIPFKNILPLPPGSGSVPCLFAGCGDGCGFGLGGNRIWHRLTRCGALGIWVGSGFICLWCSHLMSYFFIAYRLVRMEEFIDRVAWFGGWWIGAALCLCWGEFGLWSGNSSHVIALACGSSVYYLVAAYSDLLLYLWMCFKCCFACV